MYIAIIIFYISLLCLAIFLYAKRREVIAGKSNVWTRLMARYDTKVDSLFKNVKKFISYFNRKTFIAVAQFVAYHSLFHVRKLYVEIKHKALLNPHSKKVIDALRGRAEIQTQGVSLYLRRISSDAK